MPKKAQPKTRESLNAALEQMSRTGQHCEISALAGTGKTSSMIQGMVNAKGGTPKFKPSPQQELIWDELSIHKDSSIRMSAFNKDITLEAGAQIEEYGLHLKGVEAKGIHGLGMSVLGKRFPFRLEPDNFAMYAHMERILGLDLKANKDKYGVIASVTDDLVSLCKCCLVQPEPEVLDELVKQFDIEPPEQGMGEVYDLVPKVLKSSLSPMKIISWDDMIYLPLKLNIPIPRKELQIIDESQDLNRMQQALMLLAGERIMFVGDRRQAIYAFAGADSESMDRFGGFLADSPRGLRTLNLTVTRRCSKAVVEEAQKIVKEFEAHADNKDGAIKSAKYPMSEQWDKTYLPLVKPGDMVLCRVNAPLVSQCFRFIEKDIKAIILGRKIGSGLITLLNKAHTEDCDRLKLWLQEWYEKEVDLEERKKHPSELRMIALRDKFNCLNSFANRCETVEKMRTKINEIFTDNRKAPAVRCSSIHKSKGLEAEQVFLLQPKGASIPHPMARTKEAQLQEWNLKYIAITRAIEDFYYVKGGDEKKDD
jgi:superfamily I DNA/RNA helicase